MNKCGWCHKEGPMGIYSRKYNMYFCNRSHFASWKFYHENYCAPLGILRAIFGIFKR